MRDNFDRLLSDLNDQLKEMGDLIEIAITNAVGSLSENNGKYVKAAAEIEKLIDQKEKDIESLCLKILLQQHPVARDLRVVSSALKMITDMERIGDQAEDIAEISVTMKNKSQDREKLDIPKMAKATGKMVTDSITAFVNKDADLALSVMKADDYVDELFDIIKSEVTGMIHQNVENGEDAIDIIMIAKYFERIGDHATNIAEWVYFSITGEHRYANE